MPSHVQINDLFIKYKISDVSSAFSGDGTVTSQNFDCILIFRQQACLDIDEALKHCNSKEDYDRIKHIASELAADQGNFALFDNRPKLKPQ